MGAGYGFAGHIGFGKEASGGTPVAATNYIEALSEGLNATIDRFDTVNIAGRYAEPDDSAGIVRVAGDIVAAFHPEEMGFFLLGVTGVQSNSEVLSGFLHTHEFSMATVDYDGAYPNVPFTFEVFRDVTSSQQYDGCNIAAVQLAIAPNQDLRMTASIIGTGHNELAKTTPTFTNSPAEALTFDTASIQIGGAASAIVEAMTINIDNQLEGRPVLNASTKVNALRRSGPQMVRLSGSLSFEDIAEYENFRSQTEQAILLSFTKADSFSLVIDMPRVVYTAFPLGMGGRDRQVVGFEGQCRYHTGSNSAILLSLTNTTSGY